MQKLGDLEWMVLKEILGWARNQVFETEKEMVEAFWAEKLPNAGKQPR